MRSGWQLRRAIVVTAFAVAAGGCAAENAMSPPAPEPRAAEKSEAFWEAPPATIEEAQAQLDRARAQLGGGPAGGAGGAPGLTTAPTSVPKATTESAPGPSTASGGDEATRHAACVTPCRAIASMRRAVDAICRMAGAQDARCTDARKTLGESEARVAGCGC